MNGKQAAAMAVTVAGIALAAVTVVSAPSGGDIQPGDAPGSKSGCDRTCDTSF